MAAVAGSEPSPPRIAGGPLASLRLLAAASLLLQALAPSLAARHAPPQRRPDASRRTPPPPPQGSLLEVHPDLVSSIMPLFGHMSLPSGSDVPEASEEAGSDDTDELDSITFSEGSLASFDEDEAPLSSSIFDSVEPPLLPGVADGVGGLEASGGGRPRPAGPGGATADGAAGGAPGGGRPRTAFSREEASMFVSFFGGEGRLRDIIDQLAVEAGPELEQVPRPPGPAGPSLPAPAAVATAPSTAAGEAAAKPPGAASAPMEPRRPTPPEVSSEAVAAATAARGPVAADVLKRPVRELVEGDEPMGEFTLQKLSPGDVLTKANKKKKKKGKKRSKPSASTSEDSDQWAAVFRMNTTKKNGKKSTVRITAKFNEHDAPEKMAGALGTATEKMAESVAGEGDNRLAEKLSELVRQMDTKVKGQSSQEVFAAWSEEMLSDLTMMPQLCRWLESTAGKRFLLQRFGSLKEVRKVRDQIAMASEKLGMGFDELATLKHGEVLESAKVTSHEALRYWDANHQGKEDRAPPFDFTFPDVHSERHPALAQMQARVLLKTGKFIVSCDPENVLKETHEVRFKAVVKNGRRVVEARVLGTDEKYPNLEPWVTFTDGTDELLFVGLLGKEAVNYRTDFFEPLSSVRNDKLQNAAAFAVDTFEGEPVLMQYHIANLDYEGQTLRENCIGATSLRQLRDFCEQLKRQPGQNHLASSDELEPLVASV